MEKLVIIAGTNASGKSGLGVSLAHRYGAEIVSADSRQVYRGLDLGSGKILPHEMKGVPHHLIDVAEPNDSFTLTDFQDKAYAAIDDIHARGTKAFLVGGTGLYINAVADGFNISRMPVDNELREHLAATDIPELIRILEEKNPEILPRLDIHNKPRLECAAARAILGITRQEPNSPHYETLLLGVTWPRPILYDRIRERLDRRLEEGMIDEVIRLREQGATDDFLYRLGLEYRYILMYLQGKFPSFNAFREKLFMEIRHLAKEQMTWFRKRSDIHWLDMTRNPEDEAAALLDRFYSARL